MTRTDYSNREIDQHFKEIKAVLVRIEKQTTRTNGRVTELERWMWLLRGALALISILVLPVLFMIVQKYF